MDVSKSQVILKASVKCQLRTLCHAVSLSGPKVLLPRERCWLTAPSCFSEESQLASAMPLPGTAGISDGLTWGYEDPVLSQRYRQLRRVIPDWELAMESADALHCDPTSTPSFPTQVLLLAVPPSKPPTSWSHSLLPEEPNSCARLGKPVKIKKSWTQGDR